MRHAKLLRMNHTPDVQTLGVWLIFDNMDLIYDCRTLELSDKGNQRNISRINAKVYKCRKRWSKKFSTHYILEDVEGRSYILVHPLNFFKDTQGCIGVGRWTDDMNMDGHKDITDSRKAMNHILDLLGDEFTLEIIDCEFLV